MRRRLVLFAGAAVVCLFTLTGSGASSQPAKATQTKPTSAASGGAKGAQQGVQPEKSLAEENQAIEIRRQQLVEKEAALAAKEQELNALAAKLDSRITELNAAQKAMEMSLMAKKKESSERYRKILKVYRALRPEEAGKLLNKLDDDIVIEMLDQMDQKTAVKLIPHLSQPNVLKWTRDNLKGK